MDDPITVTEPLQTPAAEPAPVEPTTPPAESTLLSEPAPAAPAQPTVLTEPVSPVKADGTFIEGWKNSLPEELRDEKALDTITDFNNAIKQLVHHKKMVGKDKVVLPTDKSDENEWNLFYEAIGRPKTETGYNTPEIPEELKDIFTDERLVRAKERAYKLGATQKQFQDYLKGEIEEVVQTLQDQDEAEAKARRETKLNAEKTLRTELGAAYNERVHIANRLITEAIPKEADRIEFTGKYGNDVTIIRLLSTIGARMSEHTALIGELTQKTTTEVQSRITKLEQDERYRNINSDMSKEERQQVTDELRELYKQLHPAKK